MHRITDSKLFYFLNDTDNEFTNYNWLCGNRPRISTLVNANSYINIVIPVDKCFIYYRDKAPGQKECDEAIDKLLEKGKTQLPDIGERMAIGYLKAKG